MEKQDPMRRAEAWRELARKLADGMEEKDILRVDDVFNDLRSVNDNTVIVIYDHDINVVGVGHWYEDAILNYTDSEVHMLHHWPKANLLHIYLE